MTRDRGGQKGPRGEYELPFGLDMDADEALERLVGVSAEEAEAVEVLIKNDNTIDGLMKAFEDAALLPDTLDAPEAWRARDLMRLFEYSNWQNFRKVLARAYAACEGAAQASPADHFWRPDGQPWNPEEVFTDSSKNPEGGRPSEDVILSRYAAYLTAENADPSKVPVAFAQTYFATQTRRAELADQAPDTLSYDETRVMLRRKLREHNKALASAAAGAGVTNFMNFNGAGLKALYGGLTKARLVARKGLPKGADHLDYAGHGELAANYFKATQAEERLRREGVTGQRGAERIHAEVGRAVRQTIIDQGNTPLEDVPAEDHIREAEKRVKAATAPKAIAAPKAKKKPKKS